jgi:hypothetical protein
MNKIFLKSIKIIQILSSFFYGNIILNGPFKGIKISKNHFGSSYLPKLLGVYESEISFLFKKIITNKEIEYFLDIGCAGGYYLEIANYLNPSLKIVGIDANKIAIDRISGLETANIKLINKYVEVDDLYQVASTYKFGFILIDIEGAEKELFEKIDPIKLSNSFIIIELHKYLPISLDIFNKFHNTHSIVELEYNIPRFNVKNIFKFISEHELRENFTSYVYLAPKIYLND